MMPEGYDGGKFQRRVILIGAAPHHPGALSQLYRDIESFHRTEVFEFALQKPLPHFQPFKLRYAALLADFGLLSEAYRLVISLPSSLLQEENHQIISPAGIAKQLVPLFSACKTRNHSKHKHKSSLPVFLLPTPTLKIA